MNHIDNGLIGEVLAAVSGLRCEYAEARISIGTSTSIVLSGDQIDVLSSGEFFGGSVRVLKNGAWGFVSFNELKEIGEKARRAADIASRITGGEKSRVVASSPFEKTFSTPMGKDTRGISIDEKFSLLKRYNDILKSSSLIQTSRALYRDTRSHSLYINSEGSRLLYDKSFCGVSLTSIARDGGSIQPFSDSFAGYGGFERAENLDARAETVVKTAVDLLKAESVPGGVYNIVIDPRLAGVFIHEAFGHLSEADFVYENEQMKKIMVMGKQVGPEDLNVIDDGSIPGLPGFIPADDEGIPSQKTYLIKNGVLSGRLHSRETAYKMNESPTGNARAISVASQPIVRMTNTYIENGNAGSGDMLNSLDDGLYVCDALGGQTNLEMFTFSAGYGMEIKNGKPGRMYKDVILSGNVFRTLGSIAMIGDDRAMFGGLGGCGKKGQSPLPVSFGGPHVLIRDVLIGGKQR